MNQNLSKPKGSKQLDDKAGCPALPGSPEWLHANYDRAYFPAPGEAIPMDARCADCGAASEDAGRCRQAESYEVADDDGEIYECSTCGGLMIIEANVKGISARSESETAT